LDAPQGLAAAGDGGALRADDAGMRGLADGSGSGRRSCRRRLTHQQRDVVTLCAARPISDSHARASQGRGDTTDRMRDMRRLSLGRQFLYQESYTISKLS